MKTLAHQEKILKNDVEMFLKIFFQFSKKMEQYLEKKVGKDGKKVKNVKKW